MSTRTRGFASLSPAKRREMASKGVRALRESGKAYQWTSDDAAAASRKGVETRRINRERRKMLIPEPPPFKYPESL